MGKKNSIMLGFIIAASLFLNGAASASLLSIDSATWGQGAITRDTESGLDWLDLTMTVNRSYVDISSNLATEFIDFRYATREEVFTLFRHAGIPDINVPETVENYAPVTALMNLVGVTYTYSGGGLPLVEASGQAQAIPPQWQNQPNIPRAHLVTGTHPYLVPMGEANTIDGTLSASQAYVGVGSWLIQTTPVPPPSALLLFGSGLLGIFGFGRQTKHL